MKMRSQFSFLNVLLLAGGVLALDAQSAVPSGFDPDHVYTADAKKMDTYIREGLIVGGDRSVDDIMVLDVRHALNRDYERVVLDLEANPSAGAKTIDRPPYYQMDVSPEMKRIVITLWGKPKLGLKADKIMKNFRKSKLVKNVEILPNVEKDRWTFVLNMAENRPVEVFELSNPVRVIVDLRTRK